MTRTELIARIKQERAAFDTVVAAIDDAALAAAVPDGGWSVKDHLSHISAWERMIVAHLRDGSDHEIAGMDAGAYARASLEELNSRLQALHAVDSVEQVRRESIEAHGAIVAFIGGMPEARLGEVYWDDDPSGRTVLAKISGDTYLHYREHAGWISELLAGRAEAR